MASPVPPARSLFFCRRTLAAAALAMVWFASTGEAQSARPNILFIAADDLRTELGCYGDRVVRSPNIDALAARGVVFTGAYCQQAVCCPSRSSMLTGLRPDTIRVWDLQTYFRNNVPDVVTLPQDFKEHGYFSQDIGKIYHNDTRPASAGARMYDLPSWSIPPVHADGEHWRDWVVPGHPEGPAKKQGPIQCLDVPDDAYYDGKIASEAIAALRGFKASGQSFFLGVGFWKPHLPYNAPKKYWDLYEPDGVPPPANPLPPQGAPAIALHNSFELRGYAGMPQAGDIPTEASRRLREGYYACISYMDAQLGRVLAELTRLGLAENTIIVLLGDNGFHLGEHDLWGKTSNYELDAHIPLIIVAPGRGARGAQARGLVELLDVYPTLLELCGLPRVPGLEGRSLVPLLEDPARPGKEAVLTEHPHPFYTPKSTAMGYALRTERYRYVEWRDLTTKAVTARELYDYELDPLEKRNVVDDPAEADLVARLARQLTGLRAVPASAVAAR
jgi:iduronate 2-sulfatase